MSESKRDQPPPSLPPTACSPVTICGIPHLLTIHEGAWIFEAERAFPGMYSRMTFWEHELNPGHWLCEVDHNQDGYPASFIARALEYIEENSFY